MTPTYVTVPHFGPLAIGVDLDREPAPFPPASAEDLRFLLKLGRPSRSACGAANPPASCRAERDGGLFTYLTSRLQCAIAAADIAVVRLRADNHNTIADELESNMRKARVST